MYKLEMDKLEKKYIYELDSKNRYISINKFYIINYITNINLKKNFLIYFDTQNILENSSKSIIEKIEYLNDIIFFIRYLKKIGISENIILIFGNNYKNNNDLILDFSEKIKQLKNNSLEIDILKSTISYSVDDILEYYKKLYKIVNFTIENLSINSDKKDFLNDYLGNFIGNIVIVYPEIKNKNPNFFIKEDINIAYFFLEYILGLSNQEIIDFLDNLTSGKEINIGTMENQKIFNDYFSKLLQQKNKF